MRKLLVTIAVMSVMVLTMTGCIGGSEPTATTNPLADLQNAIVDLDTNLTNLTTKVNKLETSIPTADIASVKNDLNSLKNDLGSVKSDISSIKANITALQNNPAGVSQAQMNAAVTAAVSTLQAKIDVLTAEIAKLKAGDGGTQSTQMVEATIKYLFPSIAYTVNYPTTTPASGQFRLDIKNNSANVIKDVQFVVYFMPSATVNYSPAPTLTSGVALGSLPIMWQYGGIQSGALMFANGLGFNLAANETKSLTLTLTLNSSDTNSVQYTPYIFVGMG